MNMILTGGALAITGTSVISTIGSGVTASSLTITRYLWSGSETNVNFRDYQRRLLKLDIKDKIKLTNQIIQIVTDNLSELENSQLHLQIASGLALLSEIIIQLNDTVEKSLILYRLKWFNMYRNISIDEPLKNLETQVQILDNKLLLALPIVNLQLKYDGL